MQAPYVFISHSSQDETQTAYLVEHLGQAGLRLWVDASAIPDGSTWLNEIERGLRGCAAVVVVMTANARASEWVQAETLLAHELRLPIFIARFDDTPLPLHLITRQATDFRRRRESAAARLTAAVRAALQAEAPPVSTPGQSPDPNRHNFFRFLEQLPGGAVNSRVGRELFAWAKAHADTITFSGRSVPAFHAHVEIGMGGVVGCSLRAYPKQPALEIPLQYFREFPPYDDRAERVQVLESLNRLLLPAPPLEAARADGRPALPLHTLAQPETLAQATALLEALFSRLRSGRQSSPRPSTAEGRDDAHG